MKMDLRLVLLLVTDFTQTPKKSREWAIGKKMKGQVTVHWLLQMATDM